MPQNVEDFLALGDEAYKQNNHLLAISKINKAKEIDALAVKKYCDERLEANPKHLIALIVRADILESNRLYTAAVKDFDAALELLTKKNPLYKHCKDERDLIKSKTEAVDEGPNTTRKTPTTLSSPSKKLKKDTSPPSTFSQINQQLEKQPMETGLKKPPVSPLKPAPQPPIFPNQKNEKPVEVESISLTKFKIVPIPKLPKKEFVSAPNKRKKKPEKTLEEMQTKTKKNHAIGQWGEKFVYFKLKSDYEEKYKNPANYENFSAKEIEVESQSGAIDKQYTISCVNQKTKEKITLTLNWHNYAKESYKSRDLTIYKSVGEKPLRERVIEVKSTESATPWNAKFSKKEIEEMQQYRDRYRIFRVYNARKNSARIEKLKNPYEQLFPAASKEKGAHEPKVTISKIKLRI